MLCNWKKKKNKKKPFILTMASLLSISIFLILFFTLSSATRHHHYNQHHQPPPPHSSSTAGIIQQACSATRAPQTCQSSLKNLPADPSTADVILSAIFASTQNLKTAKSMVEDILASSVGNLNRTNAAKSCIETLSNSDRRISAAVGTLPNGKIKDGRAWMSAALAYQYDCWSGLKYVNDTSKVDQTMAFLAGLIEQTSNALSLVHAYNVYGTNTASWQPPKTERNGFWEPVSGGSPMSSSAPEFPTDLKPDVTVCNKGCDYDKIQAAVDAASGNNKGKFIISIKKGLYNEIVRVPIDKKNLVFLGYGIGKTVITGDQNVGTPGMSTYNSATVGVLGDGFMMSGVTVQNTAGPDAHQAVAFRSDSDLSLIENCEFLGNQDTLYAKSLRQLYKNCRIVGNVDFIFGNSASIFQDCTILVAPRQLKPEKGENNALTAHGRTDPAQSTGFVFQNCVINGTEEYLKYYNSNPKVHKNYLGRPWKEFSRTVFINCAMERIVTASGWMPWSGDFALKTLYYGEYGNTGDGADLSGRVAWSSKIPPQHVGAYSADNFIQGSEWVAT